MSFTDSADNSLPPPPPPPPDQADPLASPQGPQPRRPMNWPNNTLPELVQQWNPQQTTQDPNNPNRVAADQTADASSFSSGTPGPFLLPPPGPYGPHGPRAFARNDQQRFVPGAPNIPPNMWGKPRPYPVRPAMWEIPGIYSGLGHQLAQWGPGTVAPFAAMMGAGSGFWARGYAQGQAWRTNQQYQQMRMAAWQTEQELQKVAEEYGAIYHIYGDDPKYADRVKTALYNAAAKYHDEHMKEALEIGPVNAHTYATWLATKHGDLHVTNRERERDEKAREADDPILGTGSTSPAGVPRTTEPAEPEPPTPSPFPPTTGPEPKTKTKTGEPEGEGKGEDEGEAPGEPIIPLPLEEGAAGEPATAASPRGVQVASADPNFVPPSVDAPAQQQVAQADTDRGAAPALPDYSRSEVIEKTRAQYPNIHADALNAAAEDYLVNPQGYKGPKGTPGYSAVVQRAAEMGKQLNDVLSRPDVKGKRALDAVKQISPALARDVQMAIDGTLPPTRAASLAGERSWVYALAKKIDPTIDANTFVNRGKTLAAFSAGADGRNVTSVATFYQHAQQYRRDLEELRKLDPSTLSLLLGRTRVGNIGKMVADKNLRDLMGRLDADVETTAGEFQRAITGGKPTVSGTEREIGEINYKGLMTGDIDAVVSTLDRKIDQARARMDTLRTRFEAGTGKGKSDLIKMFDIYAHEGRGVTTDEIGETSRPDDSTAATVRELLTTPRSGGANWEEVPGHPGVHIRELH